MIEELLNYQEVDKKLKKIEQDIALSDDRKKAILAKNYIVESEELAAKIDSKAIELINLFNKMQENYKTHIETVKEYEALAESLTDSQEISYLNKKVSQEFASVKVIEDDISVLKTDIENTNKAFNDFKKKFIAAKADYTKYKDDFDKFKESKASEIKEIEEELLKLSKKMEKPLIDKYNKKRTDNIFPVVVSLQGANMCGGCNTELPLNALNKFKTEQFIECENCRRIIIKT